MRVGLTGGIASGKSTVSGMLRDLGAVVIDGDEVARDVVKPGTPGLKRVVEAFGDEVLLPDGSLDRARVGELVFADAERRRTLESIVHPLVFEAMAAIEAETTPDQLVVHDLPLLAEGGRAEEFDAVIVVDVPVELQVERGVARGMSEDEVRQRMASQASREKRASIATYLIDNSGTFEELRQEVADVVEQLRGQG